jgi:tetratricopeptide (TPR) repeat protein
MYAGEEVTTDESGGPYLITNIGPPSTSRYHHHHHHHHPQQQQQYSSTNQSSGSSSFKQQLYPSQQHGGMTIPIAQPSINAAALPQGGSVHTSWAAVDGRATPADTSTQENVNTNGLAGVSFDHHSTYHYQHHLSFAPAALHTTFSSVQEMESEDDDDAHRPIAQQGTEGDEGSDDRSHGEDDTPDCCQCVDVIGQLLRTGEYALCVEYGTSFMERVQPGDVTLAQTQMVLCHVTKAYIRLSEMEHAKAVLSLWGELLDQSRGGACLTSVERYQWKVRLLLTTSDLCSANGEREEAMQALVLAWRVQAYLHGPESRKCLATYVRIAEMKVQLAQDGDAFLMVQYASTQLKEPISEACKGDDANVDTTAAAEHNSGTGLLLLWSHVLRLQVVLSARQRRWSEAGDVSHQSLVFLRGAIERWEARAAAVHRAGMPDAGRAMDPAEHRGLRIALGQALMRAAEIYHSSGELDGGGAMRRSPRHRGESAAIAMFAEGLHLVSECFPPTSEEVVRARLRLATLHALRHHQRSSSSSTSSSSTAAHRLSYWEQSNIDGNRSKKSQQQRSRSSATNDNNSTATRANHPNDDDEYGHVENGPSPPSTKPPLETAKSMIQDVISLLQQADVRGGRHVHLLIEAFEALADLEHHAGDFRSAATSYHRAKAAAGQLFAPDHERCAILQHKLAESLLSAGHWEDAVSLLHELKEWCLLCPAGVRPPVPLVVLHHSLGSAMRLAEKFDKAEAYYREALADEQIDFVTKTRVLGNLAALFLTTGDIDAAIRYNQIALTTRMGKLGEHHQDVAASYANIAALYQRKRCPKQALFFSEKCLAIMNALTTMSAGSHAREPHQGAARREMRQPSALQLNPRPSCGGTSAAGNCAAELVHGVATVRAWALRALRTPPQPTSF